MTDKEKAEEILQTKSSMTFCAKGCGYTEKVKELIAIGLAEGRKEGFDTGYKKATERAYERQQDLTDTYIKDGEKIKQLEKENEELKKDKEYLDKVNNEQTKIILQLNKQIEKMKCCFTCKHCEHKFVSNGGIKSICIKLHHKGEDCILNNYEHWELAE